MEMLLVEMKVLVEMLLIEMVVVDVLDCCGPALLILCSLSVVF